MIIELSNPTDGQDMVRDSARQFSARKRDLRAYRQRRNSTSNVPPDLVEEMASMGWLGALVPQAYGGMELPLSALAAIVDELGRSLIAEPLTAFACLAARTIALGGNKELKDRLLPAIASGTSFVALAWQEDGQSLEPTALATRAVRPEGARQGIRITGRKRFVTVSAEVAGFLVTAASADGMGIYWIDAAAPGVKITTEWRADGSPSVSMELNDVAVDDAHCLAVGAPAEEAIRRAQDEAAVLASAELLGVMTEALTITLDYMRTRIQFDQPIGKFQALQHRAADLYLQRELAVAALASALATIDGAHTAVERSLAASRAKSRCSEAGMRIVRDAVQLHGAIGFTDECDIGLYLKRAIVLSGWLGNADLHKARVSRIRPRLSQVAASRAAIGAPDEQRTGQRVGGRP